jgi:hypothetical protein
MQIEYRNSKWTSERHNGGVTGVGEASLHVQGERINVLLEQIDKQAELSLLAMGAQKAERERTVRYGQAEAEVLSTIFDVPTEYEEAVSLCLQTLEACREAAKVVSIPPGWRRQKFVGYSTQGIIVEAEKFWADWKNSPGRLDWITKGHSAEKYDKMFVGKGWAG